MGQCAPDCVKNLIIDHDMQIKGNKIFKRINTKLEIENIKLTQKKKN